MSTRSCTGCSSVPRRTLAERLQASWYAPATPPWPLRGLALSVALGLLVAWLGLGVAYFSPYPVGFWTTTFGFGLYLLVAAGRRVARVR